MDEENKEEENVLVAKTKDPLDEGYIQSVVNNAVQKAKSEFRKADDNEDGKISWTEFWKWMGEKILVICQILMVWGLIFFSLMGVLIVSFLPNLWDMIASGSLTPESVWSLWSTGSISTIASTIWKIWKLSRSKDQKKLLEAQNQALIEKKKRELEENKNLQKDEQHKTEMMIQSAEYEFKIILLEKDLSYKDVESKAKDMIARVEITKVDALANRIVELQNEIKDLEQKKN